MRDARISGEFAAGGGPAGAVRRPDFTHVGAWIFDLDNTLYPHGSEVLAQAEMRICSFIENHFGLSPADAWRLQKDCLRVEGSTLSGLVKRFAIDPEPYLAFVNDVDVTTLTPAPELKRALARLPGKRAVFTNNCANYAARVLDRLGVAEEFDAVCDIRTIGFAAKPSRSAYETVVARMGVPGQRSVMFEDSERNLLPAHAMGMTTVWLRASGAGGLAPPHVHHHTDDLTRFLNSIEVHSPP